MKWINIEDNRVICSIVIFLLVFICVIRAIDVLVENISVGKLLLYSMLWAFALTIVVNIISMLPSREYNTPNGENAGGYAE